MFEYRTINKVKNLQNMILYMQGKVSDLRIPIKLYQLSFTDQANFILDGYNIASNITVELKP